MPRKTNLCQKDHATFSKRGIYALRKPATALREQGCNGWLFQNLVFFGIYWFKPCQVFGDCFLVFSFFIVPPEICELLPKFFFFSLIRLVSSKFSVFLSRFSPNRPIFNKISFFVFQCFKWWK